MMIFNESIGGLIGTLQCLPESAIYDHILFLHSNTKFIVCYGFCIDYGRNEDYNVSDGKTSW